MAQKVITEAQIRNVIEKMVRESLENGLMEVGQENSSFDSILEDISRKCEDLDKSIETLQSKKAELQGLGQAVQKIDEYLHSKFEGINGPIPGRYNGQYFYKLNQEIPYNQESDKYDGFFDGETAHAGDMIKAELNIPEEIGQYIDVYTPEKSGMALSGIEIEYNPEDVIDTDQLEEIGLIPNQYRY